MRARIRLEKREKVTCQRSSPGKLCNSTVRRGLKSFQSKSRTGLEFKASARNLVGLGEYNSSSFSAYSRRAGIEEGNYRE